MATSTPKFGQVTDAVAQACYALSGRREGSDLFDFFGGRPSQKIREAAVRSWEVQIPKYQRKDMDCYRQSFVDGIVTGYCQRYAAISDTDVEALVAQCDPQLDA